MENVKVVEKERGAGEIPAYFDIVEMTTNKVLVKPIEKERVTKGGLHLATPKDTEDVKEVHEGIVIAVGPGSVSDCNELKSTYLEPGQRVAYSKYSGATILFRGKKYQVFNEGEEFWVVNDE